MVRPQLSANLPFAMASVFTAASFFMLPLCLIQAIIPTEDWMVLASGSLIYLLLLAVGLADAWSLSQGKSKDLFYSRIRRTVLQLVILWPAVSFIHSGLYFSSLLPGLANVSHALALVFANLLCFQFDSALHQRLELHFLVNTSQQNLDNDLYSQHATLMKHTHRAIQRLRTTSLGLFLAAILLASISTFTKSLSSILFLCLVGALFGALSLFALANNFLEEHRFYAFGFSTPIVIQKKRHNMSIIIILFCILLAFPLSNSWSVFGSDVIVSFILWLLSLLTARGQAVDRSTEMQNYLDEVYADRFKTLIPAPSSKSGASQFMSVFFTAIQIGAIAFLSFFFLRFLFGPLLQKKLGFKVSMFLALKELLAFILAPFKAIWRYILSLFHRKKRRSLFSLLDSMSSPKEYLKALSGTQGPPTELLLNSNNPVLKTYLVFLEWIYKNGIRWQLSEPPLAIAQKTIQGLLNSSAFILGSGPAGTQAEDQALRIDLSRKILQLHAILEECLYSQMGIHGNSIQEMEGIINYLKRHVRKRAV